VRSKVVEPENVPSRNFKTKKTTCNHNKSNPNCSKFRKQFSYIWANLDSAMCYTEPMTSSTQHKQPYNYLNVSSKSKNFILKEQKQAT
jgi:hypothetical protein